MPSAIRPVHVHRKKISFPSIQRACGCSASDVHVDRGWTRLWRHHVWTAARETLNEAEWLCVCCVCNANAPLYPKHLQAQGYSIVFATQQSWARFAGSTNMKLELNSSAYKWDVVCSDSDEHVCGHIRGISHIMCADVILQCCCSYDLQINFCCSVSDAQTFKKYLEIDWDSDVTGFSSLSLIHRLTFVFKTVALLYWNRYLKFKGAVYYKIGLVDFP